MEDKHKKIFKFIIRLSGPTCLLLFFVFGKIDIGQLVQTLKEARWGFLIFVWLLAVVNFWIRSVRLRLILKRQDCDVESSKIFGATTITALYSLVLPGLISTGVKWYILKRHTGKASNVLSSMVYNQVSEITVRVLLAFVALSISNPFGGQGLSVVCVLAAALMFLCCVLLVNKRVGGKVRAILQYALRPLPRGLRKGGEKVLDQIGGFQNAGWSFHLKMAGISVIGCIGTVGIYWLATKAAGINVPAVALLWLSSVVYLLGRLPISIGNLFWREVTLIEFLGRYGAQAPAVFLMSMIIFSNLILMSGIGAVYQAIWAMKGKDSSEISEDDSASLGDNSE
jgi:uncharacterized membrane protein YbhN (UPF0104 family)